jgi:hypothetical protein
MHVDIVARAICAESCAHYGEPPCWRAAPEEWPNPQCDEPGCFALAQAAIAAITPNLPPYDAAQGETK